MVAEEPAAGVEGERQRGALAPICVYIYIYIYIRTLIH